MRTSVNIPEALLREAQQTSGVGTKTQAIVLALTEFIQRRKSRKILDLKGSLSQNYNHRDGRRKR